MFVTGTDEDAVRAHYLYGGRIDSAQIRPLPCAPGEPVRVARYIRRNIQEDEGGERLESINIEERQPPIPEPVSVIQSGTSPAVRKLPADVTRTTARARVRQLLPSTGFNRQPAAVPCTKRRPPA
ncbi:Hypothetical protein CINCED_3A020368 [Cinara cedri]|uniref:Uncharacterized protein n=1 Tax=Cinara cedri TaxID=506608 RepID=A0A5E4M9Q9_9HEMI|nr:Hypothetical protein CINCED_3A020368 [Cinara cedri]